MGNSAPGTIAVGTAVAAMQTGWAGNVAFNDARWPILGHVESLAGTVNENTGVISLDVSYVSGFSMPICFCSQTGKYLSGCDKNLWALNPCPDDQNNAAGRETPVARPMFYRRFLSFRVRRARLYPRGRGCRLGK
ncbi:hypothetical protein B0T25DRAFT_563053 [Lasiosphaeria hispida]|uniref:Uncharacterized protein n=1 Tax=Lasiosphaeria hispida TaxID=260671 RepID=A0AAJ0HW88_9PEZI|nr:hypothetical protein B0T25DRAFT_563053 [Lasiosphaeria hispida]